MRGWRRLLRAPWTAGRSTLNIHYKTNTEAEVPIFWPPDMKIQLIGKDLMFGMINGNKEKGTAENEMVR